MRRREIEKREREREREEAKEDGNKKKMGGERNAS